MPMKAEPTSKVKALTMKIQNEFWTNGNICGLMRNGKAEIIGTNGWIKYEKKWEMETKQKMLMCAVILI